MGRFFRNPFFLGGGVLLIFYILLYLVGPLLGFKGDMRHKMSAFVSGLAAIFLFIRWARTKWKGWRMKRAMKASSDAQLKGAASAEAREEMEALQREFDRAFEQLSRLRPATGIFASEGGESIPWIVIIGPPGNGKTTTLDASGLRFTKLGRKVRGISGTRNCEWWLAEEAIFLDTAGRYTTQEQDHDEWMGFLDLIKRYRKRRPIDGALLLVSLDEVMNLSPEEVEELGLQLKARLRELMERLGVRFPVHLVFNKLDRLDGFGPFFRTLNKTERNDPWGFVLDLDTLGDRTLADVFARRLDRMVAALIERSTRQVLDQAAPADRDAALCFPQQLAGCLENLQLLTDVIFEPQRYTERPWLRSVFFCSATQDGMTLPGLRNQVAESLGVTPSAASAQGNGPRPFFVRGVFGHIVSQAADAARPTLDSRRRALIRQAGLVTACAVGCGIASAAATDAYLEQRQWVDAVRATALTLDGPAFIQEAGQLERRAVQYEMDNQKALLDLLEYQDPGPLIESTWEMGARVLRARIDAHLIEPLRPTLNAMLVEGATWDPDFTPDVVTRGRDKREVQEETDRLLRAEAAKFGQGYLALKAGYILRGDRCEGADEDATRRWLASYLASLWRDELGEKYDTVVPGEASKQLNRSLSFFVDGDIPSKLQADASLWQRAKDTLADRAPSEEVLFNLKIQNAGLVGLESQLGGQVLSDIGLREAFTYDGCERFFKSKDEGKEWWSCLLDKTDVAEIDSESFYQNKHGEEWQRWLDGLFYSREIQSLDDAVAVLTALSREENSELDEIFQIMGGYSRPKAVSDGPGGSRAKKKKWWRRLLPTRIRSCVASDEAPDLNKSPVVSLSLVPVCSDAQLRFEAFRDVLKADEVKGEAYIAYKEALAALLERMQRMSLSEGTDLKAMALDMVLEKVKAQGEITQVTLKRQIFVDSLRAEMEPRDVDRIDALLASVEDKIIALLLPPAAAGLDDRWRSEVWERWRPIKPPRGSLLEPTDKCPMVLDFFDGTLAEWTDENLRPFLQDSSLDACRPKAVGATPFPLDRNACLQIRNRIRCARSAKCPEAAGGGGPVQLTPYRVDATSTECGGNAEIEVVYVDTGSMVYECNISRARCRTTSLSSLGSAEFRVKLKGESRARKASRYRASSFEGLVAQGIRKGRWVFFSGIRENACSRGSLTFQLEVPLPEAGPAPEKPDPCLGQVNIPSQLVKR